MIVDGTGNLLESGAQALVNTVNTVGVMGKGIALQFKERYPKVFVAYAEAVKAGEVQVGRMHVVTTNELGSATQYVINFPTKKDYKHKSKIAYIQNGLEALRQVIIQYNIKSIALPPLGCGNGGLNWQDVRPLIVQYLGDMPDVKVMLYAPSDSVYHQLARKDKPERIVSLTPTRVMILSALDLYNVLDLDATLLEIQKLVYFLQRLKEPFPGLAFQKGPYGPYAPKLTHLLYDLEGRYLTGTKFKDAKPFDLIDIVANKLPEIHQAAQQLPDEQRERLSHLCQIINGYESPLGMELLATVDWVLCHNPEWMDKPEQVVDEVQHWAIDGPNGPSVVSRKSSALKPEYLVQAHEWLLGFRQLLYIPE